MSNNEINNTKEAEVRQLSALLMRATDLLIKNHDARSFALKALETPPEQKKPLAEDTRLWLIEKTKKELNEIETLVCQAEKYLLPQPCSKEEQIQATDDIQKKAIEVILSNPIVAKRVADLQGKKIISSKEKQDETPASS